MVFVKGGGIPPGGPDAEVLGTWWAGPGVFGGGNSPTRKSHQQGGGQRSLLRKIKLWQQQVATQRRIKAGPVGGGLNFVFWG